MTLETLLKTKLWHSFEQQTRARRKQPADVLAELMRDYLETAEDVEFNEAMRRDARKSGLREADAVRLVREYRAAKQRRRAAS
ncbi:MAG: hypothetical protein M3371_04680 [Acidobacteriota bacterium]|nr:hypothetical protein [Acidobacteriota bacterium]